MTAQVNCGSYCSRCSVNRKKKLKNKAKEGEIKLKGAICIF